MKESTRQANLQSARQERLQALQAAKHAAHAASVEARAEKVFTFHSGSTFPNGCTDSSTIRVVLDPVTGDYYAGNFRGNLKKEFEALEGMYRMWQGRHTLRSLLGMKGTQRTEHVEDFISFMKSRLVP